MGLLSILRNSDMRLIVRCSAGVVLISHPMRSRSLSTGARRERRKARTLALTSGRCWHCVFDVEMVVIWQVWVRGASLSLYSTNDKDLSSDV